MKIIIPMAGMGKRMRPHTLTIPKPLIKIAGKPIVQRLVEDIAKVCKEKIDEIAFIIGDFGGDVEEMLMNISSGIGAKGKIYYQDEPLGTAHAILCAEKSLNGKIIVAFADTLFKADFVLDDVREAVVWVHKVDDPSSFGVVKTNENNVITEFLEKPKTFVSDQAIVGIYYFRDGEKLKDELSLLLKNKVQKNGEYQLTDALENMKQNGVSFHTATIEEWLDCGNKNATVYANHRILELDKEEKHIDNSASIENAIIIPPCYIGAGAKISNSIIGPFVSVGENTSIDYSVVTNSIFQDNTRISCVNLDNSMIGNYVEYYGEKKDVSIGDYTVLG
jgi:glucose-1-phosphate thymidylyltransferase